MVTLARVPGPIVLRQAVDPRTPYGLYRKELRFDFWYSCGYCSIAEIEAAGIAFQIDHYEPRASAPHLVDDYTNLLWVCQHCNEFKGDWSPPTSARNAGIRFYRPDLDDPDEHFEISGLRLNGKSAIGKFTIELLNLNRSALRRLRDLRARIDKSSAHLLIGLQALQRFSVEYLPLEYRAKFDEVSRRFRESQRVLEANLDQLREANRSEFVDVDEDTLARTRSRRIYMDELKALHPAPWREPRNNKAKR